MTVAEIIAERKSYVPPTVLEALDWFPDASPVTILPSPDRHGYSPRACATQFPKSRGYHGDKITLLNADVRAVNDHVDDMKAKYSRQTDRPVLENIVWLHEQFILPLIELDIKWHKECVFFLDLHKKPAKTQQFDHDVQKAKTVPMGTFIEFNPAGKANCLWHSEKTPSMQYYEKDNKVHCFGCNQGGDVIDVVCILYDKEFSEAVAFLNK